MSDRAEKTCVACGRRIQWRKKWERDWSSVRYCSKSCRLRRDEPLLERLERTILDLLKSRTIESSICPSEVARVVAPETWRDLMETTRRAASRLVAAGSVEIIQGGRVVDPSTARGPIRIRVARNEGQATR